MSSVSIADVEVNRAGHPADADALEEVAHVNLETISITVHTSHAKRIMAQAIVIGLTIK